jgi:aspartyl-tRNA(Asn)/glutamyl-tRNA(Gln) amidotransferase subunit A
MSEIADLDAISTARLVSSGEISASEAVSAAFRRIEERKELNAFITLCEERARKEAGAADAARKRGDEIGPLHGVPFSVKDLTNTEGVPTSQGSALFAGKVPDADAIAVARARATGAILIGKTTTPEFGHKPFTEGPYFGRTLNPWDHGRTCGGSSGGGAVAVATGMGALALGSDGGGSIRIPASCCGVTGLKATLGMVPNLQAPDLFGANSFVGPMARNIADLSYFFDVLAGHDRRDPYGQGDTIASRYHDGRVRIALLLRCGNILDPQVERRVLDAMSHAGELGIDVEEIDLDLVSLEGAFLVILRSALLSRLTTAIERTPHLLDPTLVSTAEAGRAYSAVDLWEANYARTRCFATIQKIFERYDLIASPTLSAPPLPVDTDPLGRIEIDGKDAGTIRGAWYPYTFPFNLTGHPALSMPCGLTREGLPVGLQLVARWNEDRFLLDVAARFEEAIAFTAKPREFSDA